MEELRFPVGRFDIKAAPPAGGRVALIDSLSQVPERFRKAVDSLSDSQLDTPYRDGGWTVRQVAHHVPDSHMNAYIRMKWGLTEESPAIKTYDEKKWSELPDARTAPIASSLQILSAIHERWDFLLRSMADKDFARTIKHPEWGEIDLFVLLRIYEWHGRHHVAHVANLRQRMGW